MLQLAGRDSDSRKYEDVYEGVVSLDSLGVTLPPDVRVLELVSPFAQLVIDVLVEALTVEGFICEGHDKKTKELWRLWQATNLDTTSNLAINEALVRGVSYLTVTKLADGRLRVQPLSPDSATVERDANGDPEEGIWRFTTRDNTECAIYYIPGESFFMQKQRGQWVTTGHVKTGAPLPSIIPVVNRSRIKYARGISDLEALVKILDAMSRSMTNLQVAQEILAAPLRGLFSDELPASLKAGGSKAKFEAYMGGLITGPAGTELKQLPGADLSQIVRVIELWSRQISAVTGVPPSMLGLSSDNPESAEAMRVAKERLITRAEFKQQVFGDAFEDLGRVMLSMKGEDVAGMDSLECVWRDPATPSMASKAANALQAHAQGVISAETAREFLALTPEQRKRENERAPFVYNYDTPPDPTSVVDTVDGAGGV